MSGPQRLRQKGSLVLETLLGIGLLIALVSTFVPSMVREFEQGGAGRASVDCRRIADALLRYRETTDQSPCGYGGKMVYGLLRGPGSEPRFERFPVGEAGEFDWFLSRNQMGAGSRWIGPYVERIEEDPWGRQYVAILSGFWPSEAVADSSGRPHHVWVLSAGEDGVIQTRSTDLTPVGDDIGVVIE